MQSEIIKLLEHGDYLSSTEIINNLKEDTEAKQCILIQLKQLRKYDEVKFIQITKENKDKMLKKYPILQNKLINIKIRRPLFIYFM